MDQLRKIPAVNDSATVLIENLEKETNSKKVVKRKFTTDFLGALFREGADELTLRAHEEEAIRAHEDEAIRFFIDTTNVGDKIGAHAG